MTVFLTGITGLLGHEIASQLLAKGYKIKALVRNPERIKIQNTDIEYVQGDILDVTVLTEQLKEVDFAIHTAATVSFAPKDRKEMYRINIKGTANVVNACLENSVKKLCHISSIASFGRPPLSQMKKADDMVVIDENQKWINSETNTHYAITKYLGENEVWRGSAEGLDMVIVNPSIILGEGNWTESSTQLFKYVYDQKPFYPQGYINYVDVKDVARAAINLLESDIKNDRFCVSANMVAYKDFFDKIAIGFNKKKPWFKVSASLLEVIWRVEAAKSFITGGAPLITKETAKTAQLKIYMKNDKIKKTIGFEFTPLDTTIKRVCNYLKN